VLSQTIIAMAHHRYLEMEGGQLMIDFIVRQCALPSDVVSCRHSVGDDVADIVVCICQPLLSGGVLVWLSLRSEVQICVWFMLMPLPLAVSRFSNI